MGESIPLGQLGLSEGLSAFVEELPYERRPILDFVMAAARSLPPGAEVIDIGAGDAPYRELFAHVRYRTVDWEASPHEGGRTADLIGSATDLPVPSESVDAALSTQVLEHLAEPQRAVSEALRILQPGGVLFLTAPLVWEMHEAPHDYYRYTVFGLRHLLHTGGFTDIEITPRNDTLATLAQLVRNCAWHLLAKRDGHEGDNTEVRGGAAQTLLDLGEELAALGPLDNDWTFPLGYTARAVRPADVGA